MLLFNVLRNIFYVGTQVAIYNIEGSFLIPGGRQRQTLSPLLNPAGYPGLFLSKGLPASRYQPPDQSEQLIAEITAKTVYSFSLSS
jgi:hypothetical protein